MRVRDLMTSPAVAVSHQTTLRETAALLSRQRIAGVPVVRDGELVGVVSEADIIEKERGPDEASRDLASRLLRRKRSAAAYATTAGDAMTSPPVVVEAWMSDYEAAWLMSIHDVGRLPVLDRGTLVGVVARADLVRHFARSDSEIEHDIREDVIDTLLVADVDVRVDAGRVFLEGEVEHEADLGCLRHAVSRVPGVVAVYSRVTLRGATEAQPGVGVNTGVGPSVR
jgi:CBS domain-containing protein